MRTHYCGSLRLSDVGLQVSVCGWVARRREHGEHLAFVDVRDHTGMVQCVVDGAHDLRSEYVVAVSGTVRPRPEGTTNASLSTGEVEIGDCRVEILSVADPPPFPLEDRDGLTIDETLRLRHRYVDLRRERMQRNLRLRARVNSALRGAMEGQGFVEVETPMLIASTPEGARDFVVPSRLQPGAFYALPQSPQILKQLCMVGGVDRYYQIARCLRDEDLRSDRQFEFSQLDLELSFATQEDVLAAVSIAVGDATEAAVGTRPSDIDRLTWHDAMDRFGSDKPDVRFGMELVDVTSSFETTEFKAFRAPCVKAIRVPGAAGEWGRNRLDGLTDQAKRFGAKGLVWMKVGPVRTLESPVAKFLSPAETAALTAAVQAEAGDLLLLVADEWRAACHVLGLVRLEIGRPPVNVGGHQFLWVTDFPLFDGLDDRGRPQPAHHVFTMPHPEDLELLEREPLSARSQAYDLVVNGWELGSGSVRIHRPDVQQRVFAVLGITPHDAQRRFGFLLDAFRYGAPPHAGFGMGIDRLVAVLAGEENIREVIAFPKTQSGADPLMGAPTALGDEDLAALGIRIVSRPPKG
jgi:aspartyl-tRNA synthetase